MSSLFTGTPQTATSYVTSSTDTPKWMQDAIFNQIQWAQNIANRPYENYNKPLVAGLDPFQTQAYSNISRDVGQWQPSLDLALQGNRIAASKTTADLLNANQNQYLNPRLMGSALQNGQSFITRAGQQNIPGASAAILGKAYGMSPSSTAQSYFSQAASQNIPGSAAGNLNSASSLNPLTAAQSYFSQAASQNIPGSAAGNLNRASSMSPLTAAQSYFSQAASQNIPGSAAGNLNSATNATSQASQGKSLAAANPYLQNAGQSSVSDIESYMNPYQENVLDTIAKRGARNLSENLLPSVSDSFIRAGQFGSGRMGEFGSRAVRDTQEAILNEQAQAAQQGYGQALQASQADLGRQAELGSLAGNLSNADYNRLLQGGAQFADIGQTQGQLTSQQAQLMASLGQDAGQLSAQEMQNLTNLGQTQGQLTGQQAQLMASLGQDVGQLTSQQMQNLTNLGQTQGQLTSQQAQLMASLGQDAGQLSSQEMQNLTNLGQTQGQLTNQQAQLLANLGQMQSSIGQQQQQLGLQGAQAVQGAQSQDITRQMSALEQIARLAQQQQGMRTADNAALEAAGMSRQNLNQRQLDSQYQQYLNQLNYPKQQMDWLSTQIRGLAPITPQVQNQITSSTGQTYAPSALQQLAAGLTAFKGFQNI